MELFGTPADVIEGRARVCVLQGDAPTWMRLLAFTFGRFASAIFCDPPYHLTQASRGGSLRDNDESTPFGRTRLASKGFMQSGWDGGDVAHRADTWRAAGLCAKPGAYLVAASGTRTYHRLACAIEDAGFEIEDMLAWLYAQGMPKGGDVSKRVDVLHGVEREVLGERDVGPDIRGDNYNRADGRRIAPITAPATEDAKRWEGHSSTLKPALEPCVLAQWPLDGSVARNLLAHGCGALHIDACRVGVGEGGTRDGEASAERRYHDRGGAAFAATPGVRGGDARGLWPSGVAIVHATACADMDGTWRCVAGCPAPALAARVEHADRFFFQAKASPRERWVLVACDCGRRTMRRADAKKLLERRAKVWWCRTCDRAAELVQHATVKPLELDTWIARLICPPGSVVVVPFAGTGSEGIAALEAGARVIAIELVPDHVEIQCARLAAWGRGDKDIAPKARPTRRAKAPSARPTPAPAASPPRAPQLPLAGLR